MAAAEKDTQNKELNALFRSLGELDDEGIQWREQNHIASKMMIPLVNSLWFPTTFRIYGSEAEDLKCYFPDDVGDVDIMIFQDSDNCIIDEEMLEYSPENPLHVKIKGADHPLFKSCLVEGTQYVATSALKNFDRAIFNDLSDIHIMGKIMQSVAINPQIMRLFVTNDIFSPAVTINFARSYGSYSEMLEAYKGSIDPLPNFGPDLLELLAIFVCRLVEVDYTRQLADRLNNFWQCCKTSLSSLLCNTSANTFLQDAVGLFADLLIQFMTILEEIYGESWLDQNEIKPKRDLAVPQINSDEDPCVTREQFERNAPEHGSLERSSWEALPFYNSNLQSDDEELPSSSSTAVEDPLGPFLEMEFCSGPVAELQEEPSKRKKFRDMEEAKPYDQVGGIDVVPTLRARGWPNVAKEWIKRERKWPSPEVVRKVILEGYHLVVKPPKNNGNPECDFRISFSHAEYLLSQEMNDIQRECYRCLKKCHHTHLSTQPMSLESFHLKTILMHTIEETDPTIWTEDNRAECMMKLLLNLMEALRKKYLSHFFVDAYNLFSPDCMENSELLETLIDKVEHIVEKPEQFANNLIKDQKDAKQSRKGWHLICQGNLIGSDLTVSAKESTWQLGEIEATQSESNSGTGAQLEKIQGRTVNSPSYYDLKDIYLDICRELINLALSNDTVEGLGDLERKLVESLRDYAEKYEIEDEQTFSQLFEIGWNKIYITIWLNNEGLNIERMLARIQDLVELWREPNEEADGTPDPFDPETFLMSGVFKTLLRRMAQIIEPWPAQY